MTPVGSAHPVPIDVQVIAATNRELQVEVLEGRFREDLYYRLNMVELRVPALRERVEDIPEFIDFFSRRFAAQYKGAPWRPDPDTLKRFCEFHWPGNVRQLSHVIEQSYVLDWCRAFPMSSSRLPWTWPCRTWICRSFASRPSTRPWLPRAATRGAAKLLGVHANTLTRMLAQIEVETCGGTLVLGPAAEPAASAASPAVPTGLASGCFRPVMRPARAPDAIAAGRRLNGP